MFNRGGRQLEQSGGEASTNVQAVGDVHIHQGAGPAEVQRIVQDAIQANMLQMQAVAAETVETRIREFSERLSERLSVEDPESTASLANPDVQYAVVQAGIGYARTGDEDMASVLIDLLADRSRAETRSLLAVVIDDAVTVTPRLTDGEIAILTVFWCLVQVMDQRLRTIDTMNEWIRKEVAPLVKFLPRGEASYLHLQALGCANVQVTSIDFAKPWTAKFPGLFTNGFAEEDVPEILRQAAEHESRMFIPCLRDPSRLQVNALTAEEIDRAFGDDLVPEVVEALKAQMNQGLLAGDELIEALAVADPGMRDLADIWQVSPLQSLRLSAVGVAVAHANWRRLTGNEAPLSIWISEDAS